jgi:hypothetical protein
VEKMNFKIKDEKLVGYVLLIVGLIIIAYGIISVLNLAGGGAPIEFLQTSGDTQGSINVSEGGASFDVSQMMEPLFPFFNMVAWIAIAFFIVSAGAKISSIGIKLMKVPIPDTKIVKTTKEEK